LSLLTKIYPFNLKISRSLFLKLNFFLTIILAAVFFYDGINFKFKILFILIVLLFLSPIGIYQYLSDSNGAPQYRKATSFVICIGELFLLGLILLL